MTMKIDSKKVVELRKQKGWSQQHLSDACGFNIRTIQRAENKGAVSLETLNALLATFEVERAVLEIPASFIKEKSKKQNKNYGFWISLVLLFLHLDLYFKVVSKAVNTNKHMSFMGHAIFGADKNYSGSIEFGPLFYLNLIALFIISYGFYKKNSRLIWLSWTWIPLMFFASAISSGTFTPITIAIAFISAWFFYKQAKVSRFS